MAAERSTGRTPERLLIPPVPACFTRHFEIWSRLHGKRQYGFGPSTLSWTDIQSFCQLTGEVLSRVDLGILDVIETEFFASNKRAEDRRQKKGEADGK